MGEGLRGCTELERVRGGREKGRQLGVFGVCCDGGGDRSEFACAVPLEPGHDLMSVRLPCEQGRPAP